MLQIVFSFIIGTVVGSFLNVCIYRLPRAESIVFPSSHCPNCGQALKPWDLIPIVSYLLLRGRCRYCSLPITWRYPLVELLTGFLLALAAYEFSASLSQFVFSWLLLPILIAIFFIDWEAMVVPDVLSLGGIVSGLIYNLVLTVQNWPATNYMLSSVIGMLVGFCLLWSIGLLGKLLFKKEAVGEGDWYLAALLGAWLGWENCLVAIFLAYLVAAVVVLALMAVGRLKRGDYIPFGPALVVGGLTAFFWGSFLLNWYLGQ